MKNKWFYKLLISYLPVFFLVISVLLIVFVLIISDLIRQEANQASETLSRNVMQNLDFTLKTIDRTLIQFMESEPDIEQFLEQNEFEDPMLNLRISNLLDTFAMHHSLIDEIYLVHLTGNKVISNQVMLSIDRYWDRTFIRQLLLSSSLPIQWTGVREQNDREVISLVRGFPILSGDNGIFVVNVRADALVRMMNEVIQSDVSYVQIYDQNHRPLVPVLDPDAKLEPLSQIRSTYTNFTVESGVKNSGRWIHLLQTMPYVWLIVAFITIVAGVMWILFATRRHYKPIEKIMNRVNAFYQKKSVVLDRASNEFQFIDKALDNLIQLSSEYDNKSKEMKLTYKNRLFREWVEGARPVEWEEVAEFFRPKVDVFVESTSAIAAVEIDQFAAFLEKYSIRDQYLFNFVLSNVLQDMADQRELPIWIEWVATNKLAVMFLLPQGHLSPVVSLLEDFVFWVRENLEFTITVGVSGDIEMFSSASEGYIQALKALDYKSSWGNNQVIVFDSLYGEGEEALLFLMQETQKMAYQFRIGKIEWQSVYHEIVTAIQRYKLRKEEIDRIFQYLIFCLEHELTGAADLILMQWQQSKQALQRLLQLEMLTEMAEQGQVILDELYEVLSHNHEQSGKHGLALSMREFLEQNFTHPNMSLNFLAEHFEMNAKSVSQLFKEEIGVNFIDYLIRLRMEHAQQLLKQTDISIEALSEQVGYTSSISFRRVFKKWTNCTPSEYRERHKQT